MSEIKDSGQEENTLNTSEAPKKLTPQKGMAAAMGTFQTDYSTDDLGGAANEINAENADINRANRDSREAHQWAQDLQAETGQTPEEYQQMKAEQYADPDAIEAQGAGDNSQKQLAVGVLNQMPEIQPETWQNLDDSERLAALQNVENQMAGLQGRPGAEVSVSPAGPGEFGYYDPNHGQINVGSYSLQNESVKENVDTIVHEGRHAYQDYAVKHPGFHPNEAEVAAWQENMQPGNYLTAEEYGQELYQSQPIEADAWQYGNTIASGVYGDDQ